MMKWVTKSWPIANGIPNGNAIANGNVCKQHIGKDIGNGPEKEETFLFGRGGWLERGALFKICCKSARVDNQICVEQKVCVGHAHRLAVRAYEFNST